MDIYKTNTCICENKPENWKKKLNSFFLMIYWTSALILIALQILILLQRVGSMPCPLSQTFVRYVNQCPRNSLEWNARSAIYNCSSVNQTCVKNDMFVYHCVLNSNGTMLIEVCAPLKKIYGNMGNLTIT